MGPSAIHYSGGCMKYGMFACAAALLVAGCAQAPDSSSGWKIEPDPDVVNFRLENAESVDQELVAPPFLPAHEQVASGPPRIVNIRLEIIEREDRDRSGRVRVADGLQQQRSRPGTGRVSVGLGESHAGQRNDRHDQLPTAGGEHAPPQHRLPRVDRRIGRRGADEGGPGTGGRSSLASREGRVLRVPLRSGWTDGAVPRRDRR